MSLKVSLCAIIVKPIYSDNIFYENISNANRKIKIEPSENSTKWTLSSRTNKNIANQITRIEC